MQKYNHYWYETRDKVNLSNNWPSEKPRDVQEKYQKCTILNILENMDIVVDKLLWMFLRSWTVDTWYNCKLYLINFCFTSLELFYFMSFSKSHRLWLNKNDYILWFHQKGIWFWKFLERIFQWVPVPISLIDWGTRSFYKY